MHPKTALIPVAVHGDDIAHLAILNPLDRLLISRIVAPLRTRNYGQVLGFRCLRRLDYRANPRRIDSHRLFKEYVLPRRHRRREVLRPEGRRGGKDYEVDAAIDNLLI